MGSHDLLDSLGRLVCVVEWNGANIVMENVGLYDTVKELTTNKSKFTIDSCSSSSDIVPALRCVVRKSWVGVLKEGNCNCEKSEDYSRWEIEVYLPNQWLTHKYGAKYQTAMFENP